MNFDSRTEARLEQENEDVSVRLKFYAVTCANLSLIWESDGSSAPDHIEETFQYVWNKAMQWTSAIHFYLMIEEEKE